MKNFLAVLMAVSLLLTMCCAPALAEEETYHFVESTALVYAMGLSADEWMSTDVSRAALAALMVPELLIAFGDPSTFYSAVLEGIEQDKVYLGVDSDGALNIFYFIPDHILYILFTPGTDSLGVSLLDFSDQLDPDEMMKTCILSGVVNEYRVVPQADIIAFMNQLEPLLSGE
ncbi:MAG: hypothetical protein ACI4O7_06455 [Aristaeellaceae bacterium]